MPSDPAAAWREAVRELERMHHLRQRGLSFDPVEIARKAAKQTAEKIDAIFARNPIAARPAVVPAQEV